MISTVAVGTDGSETASEAVDQAAEIARRFDAKLVLLSAFKSEPPPTGTDEAQWAYSARRWSTRVTRVTCWSGSPMTAAPTSS